MTKKLKNFVYVTTFICGIAITMMSCMNYEEQDIENVSFIKSETHRITPEQAKQNALDFVGQFDVATRLNGRVLSVAEVKAIGLSEGNTRSMSDSINLDSLFYVVNFDNNMGFVIAASDDRETPVFAYIEEGNYEDGDMLNNGYEAFIDALVEKETNNRVEQQVLRNDEESIVGGGRSNSPCQK